jgi:cyclic pyranopterin phosphate synthase
MNDRSSHFDDAGNARMVDVSSKAVTVRRAVAAAEITMKAETAALIRSGQAAKGDVLAVARLAAIQASKLTPQLIPLCHAIPIESVEVAFDWAPEGPGDAVLVCRVTVVTSAKTGVEMEAMTAASIGGLTVYDMVKSVDRGLALGPIVLLEKSGGKSGDYRRAAD